MEASRPLEIGMFVWWHRVCSNYGHVEYIPATVRKIGKRVTIEVGLKRGGTKLVAVTRNRLNWSRKDHGDSSSATENT